MQRVKNIDYDDDDIYSDEDEYGEETGEYTAEDKDNFASLTPVVRAELDEANISATTKEIEDALWHYFWDVGKSVAYLKNARTPQQPKQQEVKKAKAASKFDEASALNAANADKVKQTQPTPSALARKTEALKISSTPKAKSKGLDVPKLWAEEKAKRKSAAFVVIGHVDHGKSTLMGRLLLDTGAVAQRDIEKYRKQAAEMGKSSFALAWVMDTGSEERQRGVTVDIAQHHFSTDTVDFTILDAPGHRDFVPNMIGGASMADIAVLVVDANQLESGMKGQTREHILLAHAVGLRRIVVAVNKLDSTANPWDEALFKAVSAEVRKLLTETGFAKADVAIVPCSGLSGDNVVKAPSGPEATWVKNGHSTLLQQLEQSVPPPVSSETVSKPMRMQIADVFRGGLQNPLSVSGLIRSGTVQSGESITIQPSGESATVKAIELVGATKIWAAAGEIATLHLSDIEARHLRSGDVACSASKPVSVVRNLIARVHAVDALLPQEVDVHVGRLYLPGSINQLFSVVNAKDEVLKKKPRIIKAGQRAVLRIALDGSAPLEPGDRIVLRAEGSTIAAGLIENVGR